MSLQAHGLGMMDAATDVKQMMFIHQTQLQHKQHDNYQMMVYNHYRITTSNHIDPERNRS